MKGKILDKIGNESILGFKKTAFLCSRRIPASIVLECYDWAISQRKKGNCVISGFHSKIEKDVFDYLAKGKQPVIIVLHRGLKDRWEPEIQELLDSGRLLIITPFKKDITRGSEETATIRNQLILELADDVYCGHVSTGGNLEKLINKRTQLM